MPLSFGKRLAGATAKDRSIAMSGPAPRLFILGLIGQGTLLAYDLDKLRILFSVLESPRWLRRCRDGI